MMLPRRNPVFRLFELFEQSKRAHLRVANWLTSSFFTYFHMTGHFPGSIREQNPAFLRTGTPKPITKAVASYLSKINHKISVIEGFVFFTESGVGYLDQRDIGS